MLNLSTQQLLQLGLMFMAATGGIIGIAMVFGRAFDVRARVRDVATDVKPDQPESRWTRRFGAIVEPIARFARPSDSEEMSGLRARLMQAGWRGQSGPMLFFGTKAILALLLPFLALIVSQIFGIAVSGTGSMVLLVLIAAVGYYFPNVILSGRVRERRREIFEAFPDATDLIIVCIEAGLGLDAAIARAGREMSVRSASLADELTLIGVELRMGATRERALRNFATRSGVDEISMFVAMILQADRFGTSIAESLRVHAEELRLRRRLRAEEQAAKIPLKLLFPLIFCIFPALLLVLLGPAVIQIYRTLLPTMGGN
jgi:tight adherence protein C